MRLFGRTGGVGVPVCDTPPVPSVITSRKKPSAPDVGYNRPPSDVEVSAEVRLGRWFGGRVKVHVKG